MFTYDPTFSTSRDRLRAMLRDTNRSEYMFEDEELDDILALVGGSLSAAAAECWQRIAGSDRLLRKAFGVGASAPLGPADRSTLARLALDLAQRWAEGALSATESSEYTTTSDLEGQGEWPSWRAHLQKMVSDKP